ncbi:retrotransposon protein, putative, ty1-copia subclass [Tanacetum coccineum]|uniref:Retrotransposon protein, putative, ty1-copia subclass n=1 Tax=Tanacetum coccineum TaxID=301880 RepID=A0ABQ4XG82_9ASTR
MAYKGPIYTKLMKVLGCHMKNSKRGSIPMQDKLRLSKSQGASTPAELKRMQNVPYASAVGSIMYVVRCTRPDVVFAHNITTYFNRIQLRVSCYTDAGYLTDADDLKSQTGYVFVLNGGVVDWKSAKQSIFATSSAEAEYIVAVWVKKFISGLGVVPTIEEPINMYCENTKAITIANESGITKGARHFRAKVHYLRKVIEYGDIKLEKVHIYDNLADPFTKALAFPKHSEHTKNIGMLPASSLMIVLSIEDKLNYLEQLIPPAPIPEKGQLVAPEILAGHAAWIKGSKEIAGLMLMTMEPEIQRNLENLHAHEMLQELKLCLLNKKSRSFFRLCETFTLASRKKGISLILISLRKEFDSFMHNYYMHSMGKTVNEFHAMLKLYEHTLNNKLASALHVIQAGKGKNKLAYAPKPKIPPSPKREDPAKDSICHECGETGHWKRNCPQYLAELLKKKKLSLGASGSSIFTIELNTFLNRILGSMTLVVFSIKVCKQLKEPRLDLDSALLWHCCLGDISKKRIEKLQHDGLFNSTDIRDFEKCVSCMFGKMARKTYTHQVKRAKHLLGLIHTDLCGPFRIMSRPRSKLLCHFH